MSRNAFPLRNTREEVYEHTFVFTGTGADEFTKTYARGLSAVARQSAGVHRLSFTDHPGTLCGFTYGFQGTTVANLAGHDVTLSAWTAPSGSTKGYFQITIWNASEAAHDLVATELLHLTLKFTRSGLGD